MRHIKHDEDCECCAAETQRIVAFTEELEADNFADELSRRLANEEDNGIEAAREEGRL